MKKILSLFCCFVVLITLIGCGGSGNNTIDDAGNQQNETEVEDVNANEQDEVETKEEKTEKKVLEIGQKIENENFEVLIKNIEFSYDVLPDDTSGFYSHYPAEQGEVIVHIDTDVKNLAKQGLEVEDIMKVEVDYNDGFKYDCNPIPEDSATGFSYANIVDIEPLKTLGVRYLAHCPQEVADSENPVNLIFEIKDEVYTYKMK